VDGIREWLGGLGVVTAGAVERILGYLPQVVGALAVFLVGWILAKVLRALTRRGLLALGRAMPEGLSRRASGWRQLLHPGLVAGLVFWVVLLSFAAVAAQVLGLDIFATWLDVVFRHLPLVFIALLILLAGGVVSQLVRESVVAAAAAAGLEYRLIFGFAAQAAIITLSVVIALDLVGLDITFLVALAAILVAAVSGGAALAFGLGARTMVSNLLGVRGVHHRIKEGDRIRIGELEGHVIELGRRVVILENAEGRVTIPGHYFSERACTVLIGEDERV